MKFKSLILLSLTLLIFSCGKDDSDNSSSIETRTETFSLADLGTVGLGIVSNRFTSEIAIECFDTTPATAERRKQLLSDLYDWVTKSEGQLSMDGTSISKYVLQSLITQASYKFDYLSPYDDTCPEEKLSSTYAY